MSKQVTDILIVGVGGQGTLLTSRILADVAVQMGYDVKVSEIHGMAQRGGSVVTQVRYGEKFIPHNKRVMPIYCWPSKSWKQLVGWIT